MVVDRCFFLNDFACSFVSLKWLCVFFECVFPPALVCCCGASITRRAAVGHMSRLLSSGLLLCAEMLAVHRLTDVRGRGIGGLTSRSSSKGIERFFSDRMTEGGEF